MAAWPASLPDAPLAATYRREPIPQSVSSPMETGPPKRRRRFSVAYDRHHMEFVLTDTQRATWDTFYETTMAGGSATITGLTNPYTNAAATFQIAEGGDPQIRPFRPHATASSRYWLLALVLERVA